MANQKSTPISDDTKQTLDRFANYLYARAGFAQTTVELTVGFARRMAPVIGLAPAHVDVERYIADMYRAGESFGHTSNAIKAIERYMEFLGNPIRLGRPRKPKRANLSTLSEAKIAVMISNAPTLRERAILTLLAYSGIRNRELTEVRVRDVDIPQQSVLVECGKGAKGRVCCVAGECMEILADYLRTRAGEPEDRLFVTVRHRHPLQTQDIRKLVRVAARRAGISKRVWPHLFRHSLATALLSRGASVYSIQALLGHSNVSTTLEYYLHPTARTTRSDYYRCVPSFV